MAFSGKFLLVNSPMVCWKVILNFEWLYPPYPFSHSDVWWPLMKINLFSQVFLYCLICIFLTYHFYCFKGAYDWNLVLSFWGNYPIHSEYFGDLVKIDPQIYQNKAVTPLQSSDVINQRIKNHLRLRCNLILLFSSHHHYHLNCMKG